MNKTIFIRFKKKWHNPKTISMPSITKNGQSSSLSSLSSTSSCLSNSKTNSDKDILINQNNNNMNNELIIYSTY
jgi:hypothetical protein